jgi:ApaG protein
MSRTPRELPGLRAVLDRVTPVPNPHAPPDRPHQFSYHVTLYNNSSRAVTLTGRRWLLTNAAGQRTVIEGDGIVGQIPRLAPGDCFPYQSHHLVDSTTRAEVAYLGYDEDRRPLILRLAPFVMEVPG